MSLTLQLHPRRVAAVLIGWSLLLTLLSLASEYVLHVVVSGTVTGWLQLLDVFSVNLEESIPTWYATILLFVAASLLTVIALARWQSGDMWHRYWVGLAVIFVYLSMDEGAAIHEFAAEPLAQAFNTGGYLYFGWQILAVPLVVLFGLVYSRFLLNLPARTRYGFVLAGILYVSGAVIIEGFSASLLAASEDVYTFTYLATATLEECFEMLGVSVFIYALLDYIVQHDGYVTLASTPDQVATWSDANNRHSRDTKQNTSDRLAVWFERVQVHPLVHAGIMFIAGIQVVVLAWIVLREASPLLADTTPVMLYAGGAYAGALITGYLLSRRRIERLRVTPIVLFGIIVLLILFPVWMRLSALLLDAHLPVFLMVFVVSGFYGLWLPRSLQTEQSLLRLYGFQIIGIVMGVLLLTLIESLHITLIVILLSMTLMGLLSCVHLSCAAWLMLSCLVAGVLWFFPALNTWSNTVWFRQTQAIPNDVRTLFTDYSQHHKVDVLQDSNGELYLFQDGLLTFDPSRDPQRNALMGRLPASLMQPENALVIGAGSMQAELMIANYADFVTTVEPDTLLASVSERLFTSYNFMNQLENRQIIVADPAVFLRATDTEEYDLIVLDVTPVYDVMSHDLYTVDFFKTVQTALHPHGVFVVNLTQPLTPDNLLSRRIAATLLMHTDEVIVINTGDTAIAFAGDNLPFSADAFRQALQAMQTADNTGTGLFPAAAVRAIVGDAVPVGHAGDATD